MNLPTSFYLIPLTAAVAFGCSSDSTDATGTGGQPGSGGASSGGAGATGGISQTGGTSAGGSTGGATGGLPANSGGSGGGSSSGGSSGGGGATSTGGTAAGGGGTSGGSGGQISGGSAGTDTGGTGGSGGTEATPSAGCGTPSAGNDSVNDAIINFPSSYDGLTPMPMIFAFHGAGRTNEQFRTVDARTQGHPIEDGYVIVYLKSDGNDWLASSNQAKFSNAYDTMLESNCIDTSRVFAMGHSSGAQFITTLLCGGEDRFLGTAPVAGGIIGACNSHPAIHQIYIHGSMDQERGNNGQQGADLIIGLNGCSGSMPMDQAGCMSDGQSVDPGCSEYQGCTHRTIWCSHNDPYYNGTNHGWPCFANDAILAFFDSLSPV